MTGGKNVATNFFQFSWVEGVKSRVRPTLIQVFYSWMYFKIDRLRGPFATDFISSFSRWVGDMKNRRLVGSVDFDHARFNIDYKKSCDHYTFTCFTNSRWMLRAKSDESVGKLS